jgi:hypothetical protein
MQYAALRSGTGTTKAGGGWRRHEHQATADDRLGPDQHAQVRIPVRGHMLRIGSALIVMLPLRSKAAHR